MCPVQYDSTTKEHIQLIPKYVPVGHEIQNLQGDIRENVKKFYCAKPACLARPCWNGAICDETVDGFSCTCAEGFSGPLCEEDINECLSHPCENGAVCQDGIDRYICECMSGYEGTHCETETLECASSPCMNGGTCNEEVNRYTCLCLSGFEGIYCETDIDECNSSPCQHEGTCSDNVNQYTCSCVPGYEGKDCETDINECASLPCLNGGACTDGLDEYSCDCLDGFAGETCDSGGSKYCSVFFRVGVTRKNPEGTLWREVFTSEGKGLVQLSVGPTGVVWGVTWDGQGVIRIGVSRDHPLGTGWTYVSPPETALLTSVAVGNNVVWALTRDQKVWFRKGFMSTDMKENRSNRSGTSWIEMCGQVAQLTVGPNDQVWALTAEEGRSIIFRSGVSYEELSGREWKAVIIIEKNDQRYIYQPPDTISVADSMVSNSVSICGKTQHLLDADSRFMRSVSEPSALSLMGYDSCVPSVLGDEFMHNGKLMRTMCAQTVDLSMASNSVALHSGFEDSQNSAFLPGDGGTIGRSASASPVNVPGVPELVSEPPETDSPSVSVPAKGLTVEDIHNLSPIAVPVRAFTRQPSYHTDVSVSDNTIDYITDFNEEDSCENLQDSGSEKGTQTETLPDCVNLHHGALVGPDITVDLVKRLQLQSNQSTSTTGIPDSVEREDGRPAYLVDNSKNSLGSIKFSVGDKELGLDSGTVSDGDLRTTPSIMVEDFDSRPRPHLFTSQSRQRGLMNSFSRTVDSSLPIRNDSMADLCSVEDEMDLEEPLWMWVCGGGCVVEPTSLPKWFHQATLSQQSFRHRLQEGPWRGAILSSLRRRRDEESKFFEHYPNAVERVRYSSNCSRTARKN
eukprot:XP_011681813.1 PREDICTED: uncharacterized protein LOC100889023 [Strongylocentrotus purpuratus]